jgi:hypothetical protein
MTRCEACMPSCVRYEALSGGEIAAVEKINLIDSSYKGRCPTFRSGTNHALRLESSARIPGPHQDRP